jgi:hypothetical protein
LSIQAPRRKNVESHAEVRDFEEFEIQLATGFSLENKVVEFKCLHGVLHSFVIARSER